MKMFCLLIIIVCSPLVEPSKVSVVNCFNYGVVVDLCWLHQGQPGAMLVLSPTVVLKELPIELFHHINSHNGMIGVTNAARAVENVPDWNVVNFSTGDNDEVLSIVSDGVHLILHFKGQLVLVCHR